MKLEDISEVFIGVLTSRELNDYGKNEYNMFSIKDYDLNGNYEKVKSDKLLDEKLTKIEDILIKLIYPNRIIYINEKSKDLLVPSQMCVVRLNQEKYDSKFLKWYLESDIGKTKMLEEIRGSSIQKISVASLKKLEIPNINIEKQKKIVKLIDLWEEEKEILEQIIVQKEKLYDNLITEIIENGG